MKSHLGTARYSATVPSGFCTRPRGRHRIASWILCLLGDESCAVSSEHNLPQRTTTSIIDIRNHRRSCWEESAVHRCPICPTRRTHSHVDSSHLSRRHHARPEQAYYCTGDDCVLVRIETACTVPPTVCCICGSRRPGRGRVAVPSHRHFSTSTSPSNILRVSGRVTGLTAN
jgi:hypothetical protein